MTPRDIDPRLATVIWAAGFFDGEGSITIRQRTDASNRSHMMAINVSQKDPAPLHIFRALWGGGICQSKSKDTRYKCDMWVWRIGCRMAAACLRELEPYLVVKKEQAVLALEFQSRRLHQRDRHQRKITDEQFARDALDVQRMKDLKRSPIPQPNLVN